MEAFRECLADCGLTDLGYSGYDYTWDNRREGEDNIQVRLDRGTATASFLDIYPLTCVEHVIKETSDHLALIIKVQEELPRRVSGGERGFKFEEMWLKHEGYETMMKDAWENAEQGGRGIQCLWRRLRDVSKEMKRWSFESFGSVRAEIKKLKSKLEDARIQAMGAGPTQEVRQIERQLHAVYEKEEIMFRQ
jgi:hypothetical protein